jgi:DNA-binding MarR family transcriptional regulator
MTSLAIVNEDWSRPAVHGAFLAPAAAHEVQHSGLCLEVDVRRACKLRNLRRSLLGEDCFTGPAWGILLHLFDAHLQQVRDTVGSLKAATETPTTTVLRWLERLEAEALIVSRDDPLDARRRYVELTPAAVELMTKYFKGAATHLIAA